MPIKHHTASPANRPTGALESPAEVRNMFARIARRYDLANAVLSGGQDWLWRRRAARQVRQWQPALVLDLATGSGVLGATLARACPGARVVGADFCAPMLARARLAGRLEWLVAADGMRLPFGDAAFDVITVAFGLRNMAGWAGALAEMARVLRPGGHVLILDFSLPRSWWRPFYLSYLRHFLPRIAGAVAGERQAYEYLAESIQKFPRGEAMLELLRSAGFIERRTEELSGGIVSLYSGVIPSRSSC